MAMLIPPKYELTPEIAELLQSIEAAREIIETHKLPIEVEINIRRSSHLASALFSARIEGNPLTLDEVIKLPSRDQKKAEVSNIIKALEFIRSKERKDITTTEILTLHQMAMKGLVEFDSLGKWRKNMEAIFNTAGIAIYLPPPPRDIPTLITRLLKYIHSPKERFIPIKAVLAHYVFEKIHPFLDGNGRVGRLLMQKVLAHGGYGMKGLLPIEEYLDERRSEYYQVLDEPARDVTDYIVFMLKAINESAQKAKEAVLSHKKITKTDFLLPRRAEIVRIITDLKIVNFDQLSRRFGKVNKRTLRHDLKKLQDGGFIQKLGMTKGVYYQIPKD